MRAARRGLLAMAIGLAAPSLAQAHHSFAMFDLQKDFTVTGVVESFEYASPHSWTRVRVVEPNGASVLYSFEGLPPATLQRYGWHRATLKAGDQITITSHPFRDDRKGGTFERATLPDGRVVHQMDITPNNPLYRPENLAEQQRYKETEDRKRGVTAARPSAQ